MTLENRVRKSARNGELIKSDESTALAKSFFDSFVVEDSESNGGFPGPTCTDKSDRFEAFSQSDDLLDQVVASETVPRWRGKFTSENATKLRDPQYYVSQLTWLESRWR